jgi:hypothetical protein
MAETVTSLELFAFVVLPIAVGASAWVIILVIERRRTREAQRKAAAPAVPGTPVVSTKAQCPPSGSR